ncbi:MAG: hypothetical protein K5888_09310 [Lachnospiraceae bacterium]|nr:hypothetical protein [Lachnospiraceae bacterium]
MYKVENPTVIIPLMVRHPDLYKGCYYSNFNTIRHLTLHDTNPVHDEKIIRHEYRLYYKFMLGQIAVFMEHNVISIKDAAKLCGLFCELPIVTIYKIVWSLSFFADYYHTPGTNLIRWYNGWANDEDKLPESWAIRPKKIYALRHEIESNAAEKIHELIDAYISEYDTDEIRMEEHPYRDDIDKLLDINTKYVSKTDICDMLCSIMYFPCQSQKFYYNKLTNMVYKSYVPAGEPVSEEHRSIIATLCCYKAYIWFAHDIFEEKDIDTAVKNFNSNLAKFLAGSMR